MIADRPAYAELVAAWKSVRARGAASVREVACVGSPRTILLAEIAGPPGAPVVALSAGVHGDEPAAPWALLSLVRDRLLDPAFGYRIWPCTNPTGYAASTRENRDGVDINRSFGRGGQSPEARAIVTSNRDRKFALAIDMHEDFEADGFYLYEPVVDARSPYGGAVVRAMDEAGYAVQELDDAFELGYPPEALHLRTLERGRVLPDPDAERRFFEGTPYSLYVLRRAAERVLTLESPCLRPWLERIAMQRTAVVTSIDVLRGEKKSL